MKMRLVYLLAVAHAVPFQQPVQESQGSTESDGIRHDDSIQIQSDGVWTQGGWSHKPEGLEESPGSDFDEWTRKQAEVAFDHILQNIGGLPALSGVPAGVVIASPLKAHPDYYYNWIRDSALTVRLLIYRMRDSGDLSLRKTVEQYILVNHYLQRLPNLSGTFEDRLGLGEPKFNADMTAFEKLWGRPQSDGPALRVLTIVNYMKLLEENGELVPGNTHLPAYQTSGQQLEAERELSENAFNALQVYHEILRPDLEYVVAHWKTPLFDLWEEVHGMHFFTVLVLLRAVSEGEELAKKHGDSEFSSQLQSTFSEMKSYIASAGFIGPLHIIETPLILEREGLDAASLLAALHAHNLDFGNSGLVPYDVDDAHILNTIAAMVLVMRKLYPINSAGGIGLGRYPEDIYNGDGFSEGNPWFICTASAAEVLYKMIHKKRSEKSDIRTESLGPFLQLLDIESAETLAHGSAQWTQFLDSSLVLADSFLAKMRLHIHKEGRMLEQFNKYTGFMQGAADLTWSYSSFYNCVRWRERVK